MRGGNKESGEKGAESHLQSSKFELFFYVVVEDEVHGCVTEIAYAIEKNDLRDEAIMVHPFCCIQAL